jgi:hypothetical protein
MKRYKNMSGCSLPIDCITHTKYMMPGEIASLPMSRDVRHYSMLRKLVVVNGRIRTEEKVPIKKKPPVFKIPIIEAGKKENKTINSNKDGDK